MVYEDRVFLQRPGVLSSLSGIGDKIHLNEASAPVSTAVGEGNRSFYVKVHNPQAFTATHGWLSNGTTVAGNIDIGVYRVSGQNRVERLGSTGSTTQVTVSTVQLVAFGTPFVVPAGEVVLAISFDTDTATIMALNQNAAFASFWRELVGMGQRQPDAGPPEAATVSFPLPATVDLDPMTLFTVGPPIFGVSNLLY